MVKSLGAPRVQLIDSVGLLLESLFPPGPSILSPTLPHVFPSSVYSLVFGCGSLHLFWSAAGWSLSEDNYARLLPASITEYR